MSLAAIAGAESRGLLLRDAVRTIVHGANTSNLLFFEVEQGVFTRIETESGSAGSQDVVNKEPLKRHRDCYLEGASDVPAAGVRSGQPAK